MKILVIGQDEEDIGLPSRCGEWLLRGLSCTCSATYDDGKAQKPQGVYRVLQPHSMV